MQHTDTRVQYTKFILKDALLKLLEQKVIGKISVKELCEAAGLNRGTFYLHYSSPEELLAEIEEEFLQTNRELFLTYMQENSDANVMEQIFGCLYQNRDLCRIIMGSNGNFTFTESLKNLFLEEILASWQKRFPENTREDLAFILDYVYAGSMYLILDWLKDDKNIPVMEFTNRLTRLGYRSLQTIQDFNGPYIIE